MVEGDEGCIQACRTPFGQPGQEDNYDVGGGEKVTDEDTRVISRREETSCLHCQVKLRIKVKVAGKRSFET